MQTVRHADAVAFLARAEAFLLADEPRYSRPLGVAQALARPSGSASPIAPDGNPDPAFFATVEVGGEIRGTVVRQPGQGAVMSFAEWPGDAPVAAVDGNGWMTTLIAALSADVPNLPSVEGPPVLARAVALAWPGSNDAAPGPAMGLRLHVLTSVEPVPTALGRMRRGTPADLNMIARWFVAMREEILPHDPPIDPQRGILPRLAQPGDPLRALYLWETPDGVARAVAGTSGPTPRGVRINAVYTPPEDRGQGFASALVAELSRRMLATDRRFCALYTDRANPTSNRIYARIGYRPIADADQWLLR